MYRIFFLLLFIPLLGYSQNIITFVSITKIERTCIAKNETEYDIYRIKISPGYRDHFYKFILIRLDSADVQTVLSQPEIRVDLIVHRNDYKRRDEKVMWDYKTEVKSNETFSDEYFEISDCSFSKDLICLLRVKGTEKFKVKVFIEDREYYKEFEIGG